MKLSQQLARRPRLRNALHRFHLLGPCSQTNERELSALAVHAAGKLKAVEIGTFEGVSAARIAASIRSDGVLYCVDPWVEVNGAPNPCFQIAERNFRRTKTFRRIKVIRGFSNEVSHLIPEGIHFAFIDGDHSWAGIETDWNIVSERMTTGGIVALHDTATPPDEPWRTPDSVHFFQEVIAKDQSFEILETVHSLTVLRKLP